MKDLQPSGAKNNNLTLPGYSSKKSIAGLAIFSLKKLISGLDIWPGLDGSQPAQLIPCSPLNNNEIIAKKNSAMLTPQKHKYCSSCLVPAVGRTLCNSLVYIDYIG